MIAGLLFSLALRLGFYSGRATTQLEAEMLLLSIPDPERFGAHLLYLTEEPHPAGSERNMELERARSLLETAMLELEDGVQ